MAAEGIMTLAPESAPQGPMPTAPQQMDPMQDPGIQALIAQDPAEAERSVDGAVADDPATQQEVTELLSSMSLTPEVKQALLAVVTAVLENPGEYEEIRQELLSIDFPVELLPETLDIEFFSTLRYALLRAPTVEQPVQNFKDGGPVSLKPIAKFLQDQGRQGDTILAHINPLEAALLKQMGGSGTINPVTGLPEFIFKKIGNAVKAVVKPVVKAVKAVVKPVLNVTKKLLSNPVVRVAATVAAVVFTKGAALKALGTVGIKGAAASAVAATAASTGVNLLAGDPLDKALKNGITTGVVAGGVDLLSGVPLTGSNVPAAAGAGGAGGVDSALSSLKGVGNVVTSALKNPWVAGTAGAALASSALGGGEKPSPDDLQIPGVGGPTGADLLRDNPAEYGITIGGADSVVAPPPGSSPGAPGVPFGTVADISVGTDVGSPVDAQPSPGVTPGMPSNTPSYALPTPDFSTVIGSSPTFTLPTQTSAPTQDQLSDPNSPFFNPFAAQLAMMQTSPPAQQEVQAFAKGGIATMPVQKFAKGGKVVGRTPQGKPIYEASSPVVGGPQKQQLEQNAKQLQRMQETARAAEARTAAAAQAQRIRQDQASAAAQKAAAERRAAEEAAAARARQEAEARARQEMEARKAAEEAARQKAEQDRINAAVGGYRERFVAGETPEISDKAVADALARDRASNPTAYMTPVQKVQYEEEQAFQRKLKEIEEAKKAFDIEQARIAEQNRKAAELAKAAEDFEAYKRSMTGGVSMPTGPSTGSSTAAPIDITVGTSPSATPITSVPVTDGGVTSAPSIPYTTPVFDPFSPGGYTPPTVNPFLPSNAPNPFAPAPTTTEEQRPVVGFAQGGIAAMAPSRFKSGGIMTFPRKIGPINGPGTATSDSIPAMLSDGEFVFTAKAVRNFGNGSRREGAKKMYQMMKALERKA